MARPGILTHRKFVRLARLLKSDALAVGHLEIIWQACYESGDPVLGNSDDVEYLARWKGDAGMLTSALVESGFLDDDGGQFSVHDLFDHAPDYVQRRMEREHERRVKGVTLSELRAKAGRASGLARRKQAGTTDEQVLNTCLNKREQTGTNGATPAPAPAPALEEEEANGHATTEALIAYLRSPPFGLTEAERAVTVALGRGCGAEQIKATADYWLSRRPRWSEGQLCRRLEKAMPTDKPDAAWPRPDKNAPATRPKLDPEVEAVNREVLARQRGESK